MVHNRSIGLPSPRASVRSVCSMCKRVREHVHCHWHSISLPPLCCPFSSAPHNTFTQVHAKGCAWTFNWSGMVWRHEDERVFMPRILCAYIHTSLNYAHTYIHPYKYILSLLPCPSLFSLSLFSSAFALSCLPWEEKILSMQVLG